MDKYEYRVSLNEINSLVQERRFDEAAEIADTIDWRKVKSADTLCRISDIYKICKDYERARDILDIANVRNPHVPNIVYSLCELTIFLYGQTGSQADLAKALGLKQEYESECPDDPKRLILEYKFYKVSPVTMEEKIATLEQLRDEDPTARWEYELAMLYHQNGQDELALRECKDIQRAYSGKFADKAAALAEEISPSSAPAAPAEEPAAAEPAAEEPAAAQAVASAEEEPAYEEPVEDSAVNAADAASQEVAPVEENPTEDPAQAPAPVEEPAAPAYEEPAQEPVYEEPAYEEPAEELQPEPEQNNTAEDGLSVGQVYDEWERIRRDIRKRNDEQRAQRIMQDTGPLLQDFDETARHGLIETIEKEAARQRRQARSGASRILGDNGYAAGGRYEDRYNDSYNDRGGRYNDRYEDRRYEPLPNQDEDYPEDDAEPYTEDRYPDDNYQDDNYREESYADDRYVEEEAPAEEAPVLREAITAETVREGGVDRGEINDHRSYARESAPRGSAFNAAVAAAAGAAAGVVAADAATGIADAATGVEAAEDIATRRWNSDEIRAAMEKQRAAAEEAARKEAEEKARQEAEEAARKEAERKAAERAQIEAEVRAQIAAEQKAAAEERARQEAEAKAAAEKAAAEERARQEAEAKAAAEKAAAEEKARKEAEAKAAAEEAARKAAEEKAAAEKQQMYAEIEARIRAEYEAKLAASSAAPQVETADDSNDVVEEDVEALAEDTDDGINQVSPEEEPDVPDDVTRVAATAATAAVSNETDAAHSDDLAEAIEQQTADSTEYDHIEPVEDDVTHVAATAATANASSDAFADEAAEQYEPATSGNPVSPAISAETENLPASAASNIASANEKAPSPEELRLFGPFYRMKENRDQVTTALDKISLASYTGNLIITGNAVTARRVAQGLLELTREADSNFTGKIAKATGTALNNLTDEKFRAILSKIENGALIIEHASAMDEAAVQRLYNELEGREHGIIVVLMDARKPIDAFLADYQGKLGSFTARVDIRPLNDKALVDYGKDYANSKDYALDEMAELALASRISGMQSTTHRVTLKEVRDIIDEAISYASRKTPATLMGMISRKRYDEDDRIILHEKDFQHY